MKKLLSLLIILFFVGTAFGASVILNPRFLGYDGSTVLSGGKLYTYECGTMTPKTTYTDYTGGTANANPVVLGTDGEAAVYCSGCVKLVLKDSSDTTIWTTDNVQAFDSSVLQDADRDTKIQCEESADEDVIRFDVGGTQKMYIDSDGVHTTGVSFSTGYGIVHRPAFRWKDADEIYIGAGAYHHSGTTEQFLYWASEITFELESAGSNSNSDDYGADGWHYIYLDDTAIVTQASTLLDADCFLNETTAPSWSATKHGWYNGNDRCIFAVYETGSAILEFFHDGGDYMLWAAHISERAADTDDTFIDVDMKSSIPGFSTKAEISGYLQVKTNDATVSASWRTNGQTDATGHRMMHLTRIGTDQIAGYSGVTVITDSAQIIEVKLSRSDADVLDVECHGWYFPNGM